MFNREQQGIIDEASSCLDPEDMMEDQANLVESIAQWLVRNGYHISHATLHTTEDFVRDSIVLMLACYHDGLEDLMVEATDEDEVPLFQPPVREETPCGV